VIWADPLFWRIINSLVALFSGALFEIKIGERNFTKEVFISIGNVLVQSSWLWSAR